jgi:hypothetical protein
MWDYEPRPGLHRSDVLWPVSKILFWNLNNKADFLEHVFSKFEHSTQSAPEASFLSVRI